MRDDLGQLRGRDAAIERALDIKPHLDRLVARNQGCHGDDAAVSCRKVRPGPDFRQHGILGVLAQSRRNGLDVSKCDFGFRQVATLLLRNDGRGSGKRG